MKKVTLSVLLIAGLIATSFAQDSSKVKAADKDTVIVVLSEAHDTVNAKISYFNAADVLLTNKASIITTYLQTQNGKPVKVLRRQVFVKGELIDEQDIIRLKVIK